MSASQVAAHVQDPARLAALRAVALLDTPTEEAFDRLSRLAVRFVNAPVALVSLVDANRQFFKSCIGLPEPWNSRRETPLSHSFCQHNRVAGRPMVIEDARTHPVLKSNLAVRDLNVIAYLGIPLATSDGYVLGSFCVIDSKPRKWGDKDIAVIQDLAAAVMTEIQLRTEVAGRQRAEGQRDELARLNTRLREEFAARVHAEEQQRHLMAQLHHAQKMEAIGRLAGGVAHDLNNLLTPILAYTELLLAEPGITHEQRQSLDEILHAGVRARDLVRQLLAFSRKQTLELKPVNLNTAIDGVVRLLRRTIPEDIDITVNLSPDIQPVIADVGQIERLIVNLAVNATDAMPGGGELTLESAMSELDDPEMEPATGAGTKPHVLLSVRDTGCGMDEETRERVFEPFFSTKGEAGTGFGLATVFGIVKQHGGAIRLKSEPGEGTAVMVFLPVAADAQVEESKLDAAATDLRGSETILLVEDNAQVRNLARAILEQEGYTVLTAKDGQAALARLASHEGPVHVLLTDVVMPGMNGRELFERAVRGRPDLKVLYMSGYADTVVVQRGALDEGVQFIQKPFSIKELPRKIRELLQQGA